MLLGDLSAEDDSFERALPDYQEALAILKALPEVNTKPLISNPLHPKNDTQYVRISDAALLPDYREALAVLKAPPRLGKP